MTLFLHNPINQAHLEELRTRLTSQLHGSSREPTDRNHARIEELVEVVRSMDHGLITSGQAVEAFNRDRVPGFSFGRWLVDMVDEGIYLDGVYSEAA